MSSVRVDALDLKLLAPGAMRPAGDALKSRAEGRFMPAVLTAMGRRLSRIYGEHAVVRIRRLKIRCGMRPSELEEEQFAEMIGEDLASYVEQLIQSERGSGRLPSATAAAQVYRDTAHLEAAELIAAADWRAGPSGTRQDFGRLWSGLARAKPVHVEAVLARCLEARKLEPVLARLDGPALAALEPIVAGSRVAGLAAVVARARAGRTSAAAGHEAGTAGPPPAEGSDDSPPLRRRTWKKGSPARSLETRLVPPPPEEETVHEPDDEAPANAPPTPVRSRIQRRGGNVARSSPDAAFEIEAEAPHRPKKMPPDASVPEPPALAPQIDEPDSPEAEPEADASYESNWCALLFLVNVSQRLELPERLWQVGVDEGAVLAAALARLAGDDEDPAPRLLSAAFPEVPPPVAPVPDWARDEIRTGVLDAAAHLLGAPVEPLRARVADLDAFYSPGPEFDLVGWCAACHLAVAEAMLGQALAPGAIGEHFARPGRIEIESERYRVIQPLAAIDVDMRRAGLDADPGFLPWLGRKLLFVFEGDEA